MIELQEFWNKILEFQKSIGRLKKSSLFWEKELSDFKKKIASLSDNITFNKMELKKFELELAATDDKLKKFHLRKDEVKNEREIKALEMEIDEAENSKDALEDKILSKIDEIEHLEKNSISVSDELIIKEKQVSDDLLKINEEIEIMNQKIMKNKSEFDSLYGSLSAAVSLKFMKLLNSKEGRAISLINGEICTGCNFKLPPSVSMDAMNKEKLVSCTNCGRFIYSN
ncbi:MAG: C4-type zinc ribbon domain-containing protein [Spirochaetes bacterium]|jgi:predicted  nucleic acid-binding Zn-ribbon protein|nr:C4-type zinc ribbon domain-containing protein [Spirochaetota bacterium]